jgi:hypothetical protein
MKLKRLLFLVIKMKRIIIIIQVDNKIAISQQNIILQVSERCKVSIGVGQRAVD